MTTFLKVSTHTIPTGLVQIEAAEKGGTGLKYTIMTFFSVNMLLKVALAASASHLWSIIHVLQALRYILMINVRLPILVKMLMKYMAVAVGDIEELEDILPNVITDYMIDTSDISSKEILYDKFIENGNVVH